MSVWNIEYQGQSKSVEGWGMTGLKLNFVSQGADSLSMKADGLALNGSDVFDYGQSIKLIDPAGVVRFVGTIIDTPSLGEAASESRSYYAEGPWWQLDNLVYQLRWTYYVLSNGVWTSTPQYSPHLLLGIDFAGANWSTSQQINDVIDYVISQGIAISKGIILPARAQAPANLYPPPDEGRDITCAEAIKKMLRWHPDAVTWFDYTKAVPELNIRVAEDLTAVTVFVPQLGKNQANQDITVESITAKPRFDLKRDVVSITFISKGSVNNKNTVQVTNDIYPLSATGRELGALAISVDLQGAKVNTISAPVESAPVNFNTLPYWLANIPELSDLRVDTASITGPTEITRSGVLGLPFEIINGAVAEWMVTGNVPAAVEEEVIAAKFSFLVYLKPDSKTPDFLMEDMVDKVFTVRRKMTNIPTGVYSTLESFEGGDLVPVGLAQYLYNSLHVLTYEGTVVQVEEFAKGTVSIGNRVNASPTTNAAWSTMNALVQRVSIDIDSERTTVQFGPPPHLSAGDLIDLLKVGRRRQRFTNRLTRSSGEVKGSDLELPKYTEATDTVDGQGTNQRFRVKAKTGPANILINGISGEVTGKVTQASSMTLSAAELTISDGTKGINAKAADCVGGTLPRTLVVREIGVCETVNGVDVTKKMLVIGSPSY